MKPLIKGSVLAAQHVPQMENSMNDAELLALADEKTEQYRNFIIARNSMITFQRSRKSIEGRKVTDGIYYVAEAHFYIPPRLCRQVPFVNLGRA